MASNDTQPNQIRVTYVMADGVLTITQKISMNPTVATSLADEASATSTVTSPASGELLISTVITPNSAIATADNTLYGAVNNLNLNNA